MSEKWPDMKSRSIEEKRERLQYKIAHMKRVIADKEKLQDTPSLRKLYSNAVSELKQCERRLDALNGNANRGVSNE